MSGVTYYLVCPEIHDVVDTGSDAAALYHQPIERRHAGAGWGMLKRLWPNHLEEADDNAEGAVEWIVTQLDEGRSVFIVSDESEAPQDAAALEQIYQGAWVRI